MTATHAIYLLGFAVALAGMALRYRHSERRSVLVDGVPGFRAGIGFSKLDGMQSISLLLENEGSAPIWVEEIEITLSDLSANNQTADASCREVLKILQVVGAHDLLPISLAGVIYKAAGGPQREYSGALAAVLRFRIGENWFERKLQTHRVRMVGLTASGLRRESERRPEFAPREEPRGIVAAGAKFK